MGGCGPSTCSCNNLVQILTIQGYLATTKLCETVFTASQIIIGKLLTTYR